MPKPPAIRRALLSVFDKTGLVDFGRALADEFGVELISTGGTARTLRDAGLAVTLVEDVTGFPEMMDGRVKTLHPRIHAAILADRDNAAHMQQLAEQQIEPIDLVAVNLYPFEKTVAREDCSFADAIEMIDIGGPCLLRAAAKNHRHVTVVSDPGQYASTLRWLRGEAGDNADWRRTLAAAVYAATSRYDAQIVRWLRQGGGGATETLELREAASLRYGENPHQAARLLRPAAESEGLSLVDAAIDCDDEDAVAMSYNNYVDADAALQLCAELSRADIGEGGGAGDRAAARAEVRGSVPRAVCFIKHTNACGAGVAADAVEAYRKAYLGDPNAAMGGILAVDFAVDRDFAQQVMDTYATWGKAAGAGGFFVEVWIAPRFDADAVELIRAAKPWGRRVRLLAVGELAGGAATPDIEHRRILGGMLAQERDAVGLNEGEWRVVTQRAPTPAELRDLRLAWLVCKHTKSNAISVCRDGMLLGVGAGQMSRVTSCRLATQLAAQNGHADRLAGAAAASDAFFPFPDGLQILAEAGVTAIVQPGGAKRDDEVIGAADQAGLAMILTGVRHFRH